MQFPARQLVLQLAACFAATCLLWPLRAFGGLGTDWLQLSLATAFFATTFAFFTHQVWWWRLIHAAFAPALYVSLQANLDPLWYLLLLTLTLLFSPGVLTDRVPLFRSNPSTLATLSAWLAETPPRNFFDLGAGLGDVPVYLAPQFPATQFHCYETAPLSYLIGRIRTAGLANVAWHYSSLWYAPLEQADIAYCFLSPAPMPELWLKAVSEMPPGAMLISNSFPIPDLSADICLNNPDSEDTSRPLYCYRITKQRE